MLCSGTTSNRITNYIEMSLKIIITTLNRSSIMKRLNNLVFILIFSLLIFSCNKKRMGYFSNHTPVYEAASDHSANAESLTASASYDKNSCTEEGTGVLEGNRSTVPSFIKKNDNGAACIPAVKEKTRLSREERKVMRKQVKEVLSKKDMQNRSGISDLLLVIIAIILPPLAVGLVDGLRAPFWLDILLTILFYIPGLIYALYRIFRTE